MKIQIQLIKPIPLSKKVKLWCIRPFFRNSVFYFDLVLLVLVAGESELLTPPFLPSSFPVTIPYSTFGTEIPLELFVSKSLLLAVANRIAGLA